jgi:ATP-dependent 26S proteasome regulatory subunit
LIEFPLPGVAERRLLWQRHLPECAPLQPDIDFAFLAERFAFAGGDIRNAVLAAGFRAASEDCPIGMVHLLGGVAAQLRRQGRLPTAADFGGYAAQLDM